MTLKCLLSVVVLLWTAVAWAQSSPPLIGGGKSPAKVAYVTANLAGSGPTIPSSFIGISTEVGDLISGYYQGTTGNAASMISLLQLLGSNGVFVFGGSTSDQSTSPALTQNIANNAHSFLAGVGAGWASKVVYSLDLFANNSALAATQAGFLATAFGASSMEFMFSNEPFASGHFADIGTYQTAWNAYFTAVTGAVSGAGYAAWTDSDIQNASSILPGLTPGLSGMAEVAYHRYGQGTTAAQLISYVPGHYFFMAINQSYLGTAVSKQRVSESNSLGNGGVDGISNRLMSATFILNEAAQFAALGYAGLNVHNRYSGGPVFYAPLAQLGNNNFTAAPAFYGMMLFSKIQGQQIIPSAVGGNANVVSIATKGGGGNANIIAINNDTFNPSAVTPDQSSNWSTANVLQIKGSSCSEANPTIGGASIGESGVWSGAPFSISKGQSVVLGPCEAALVQIQP